MIKISLLIVLYMVSLVSWYIYMFLSYDSEDFCSVSKIKRKLSNEMFSKTSDYDATERLVEQTANSLMKMKPRNESYEFVKCNYVAPKFPNLTMLYSDPEVEIMYDESLEYPIGYLNNSLAREMLSIYGYKYGINFDTSYFDEPWDDEFLDKVMEKTVLNARELLPQVLNSIGGGLSVWIIIGINQLVAMKIYSFDFPFIFGCAFNQTIMWLPMLVPAIPFLPRENEILPGASWTRPTSDLNAKKLMTEYVRPLYEFSESHNKTRYYGQLIADIAIDQVFGSVTYLSKPSGHGFYFLMSMENGAIVSATNDAMVELFHNETANVDYFYSEDVYLTQSPSGWNVLFDTTKESTSDHILVDSWKGNFKYYVTWNVAAKYKYALVAAIPEYELFGASWTVEPSVITFRYTTGETKANATLTIKNTGLYDGLFTISTGSDTVTILDYVDGYQVPLLVDKSVKYTFEYDLTKEYDDNLVITFSPAGDNIECYTAILTPVKIENIDCSAKDYTFTLGECSNYYRDVIYSRKNTSYCRDGMSLPDPETIPCEWIDGGIFISFTVIVCAFVIFTMVYTAIKQIKKFSELRALLAPVFFYTYSIGMLLLVISALVLAIGNLKESTCTVYHVFRGLGYSFIATALWVTLMQINTKYVNNDIIFIKDFFYLLEFFLPVLVLEAIILYLTSPFYDDWEDVLNGQLVIVTSCMSADSLKNGFLDILIMLIAFINIGYAIKILTSKAELGKSTLQVTRACGIGSFILFINPLTSFIRENGFPNQVAISYIYVAVIFLLIFVMIALTPFKQWFFCRNPDISPDNKSMFSQVLKNPITRMYLQKHMKDLLQEENIIFWEAVNELRNSVDLISEDLMHQCIVHVYNRFISENGDLEININDSMKKQITKEMESTVLTLDIFDKAMTEIEDLINVNAFYTFQSSAHFEGAKTLMNWYNNYAKMEPQAQSAVFMKVMQDGIYISGREYFINGFDKPPQWENTGFGGVFRSKVVSLKSSKNSSNMKSGVALAMSGANSSSGTGLATGGSQKSY